LIQGWIEIGQPYDLFWELSFREIDHVTKGAVAARRNDYKLELFGAWHVVALTRSGKRMPSLKRLLGEAEEKKPQSWQDMLAVAKMITAMLNLKENRNGK
jgi:hypothetical protein